MAPQIVEAAAGAAAKEYKKESAAARLLGSGQRFGYHLLQLAELTHAQDLLGLPNLQSFTRCACDPENSTTLVLTARRSTPLRKG